MAFFRLTAEQGGFEFQTGGNHAAKIMQHSIPQRAAARGHGSKKPRAAGNLAFGGKVGSGTRLQVQDVWKVGADNLAGNNNVITYAGPRFECEVLRAPTMRQKRKAI